MTATPLPRRQVMLASSVLVVGAGVAACSSRHDANPPQGTRTVTVKKTDVPVGGGYVAPEANFVVTQPVAGTYAAFVKICPHAGCAVGQVTNNHIVCPCHGSQFAAADGHVEKGPATSGLGKAKLVDNGDTLTISG